jgi:hypothetical protein
MRDKIIINSNNLFLHLLTLLIYLYALFTLPHLQNMMKNAGSMSSHRKASCVDITDTKPTLSYEVANCNTFEIGR